MSNRATNILLAFFLISFSACRNTATIQHIETSQYVFSDTSNTRIDSSAWYFIRPYRDSLDRSMSGVLAVSAQVMVKNNPEGLLGDFAADACAGTAVEKCKSVGINPPDFTFLNSGGLRAPLPIGPVTLGNIYELMPFENELVILSLSYPEINQLLNYIAERGGTPVSGLRMNIRNKKPYDILIKGDEFDSTGTYRVLTSDYLANGGDNLNFLVKSKKENLNLKVRDAMIYYLHKLKNNGDTLIVTLDGRIRKTE